DDFGTGYSSLAYLKRLPIDVIKIDQSFVRELDVNATDENIVGTIIGLAGHLGFKVVAEGVENGRQAQILRERRYELLQGFLFSRPVESQTFAELLRGTVTATA